MELSNAYLEKARKTATDRELLAHIIFAQAKNAQQLEEQNTSYWTYKMVVPHEQFNEFDQYAGTVYHGVVSSNCIYYRDYHN